MPSFEELVRRRLEAALCREKPDVRTWVERGAVFGPRLDVPPRIAPALDRIGARTGYLERTDEGPDSFRFADERTREAICRFSNELWLPAEQVPGDDPLFAILYEREGEWRLAAEETALAAAAALKDEMPSQAARLAQWTDQLLARAGDPVESPGRLAAAEIRAQALLELGRYREIVEQLAPWAGAAQSAGRAGLLFLLGTAGARLTSSLARRQGVAWLEEARQNLVTADDPALAARIHLEETLVKRNRMDPGQARRTFSKAQGLAARARDVPLQLLLARRSRLFLEPGASRLALEHALKLADESGRELEAALCFNNLGVVFSELGLLGAAECHALVCLEILEPCGPWGTAVPLNNLAHVAVARGEWERAAELWDRAEQVAGDAGTFFMVRCNRARLRALTGEPGEAVDDLRRLDAAAARVAPSPVRQAILFNLSRALLEAGQAADVLVLATVPPPCLPGDEDLARGALAALRLQAFRRSGSRGRPEKGLLCQSRLLESSSKPQAWMYQTLWARGDLLFL